MTGPNYLHALTVAEQLTNLSDDALYEQLGLRIQDMQNIGGYERMQHYTADFQQDAPDMLSTEDLKKVGRRWWAKLEPELMKLVCSDNADMQQITSGNTMPQLAASLATAAVVSTFAPPAWIIVATSILALKISDTGLKALCETWQESMQTPS